MATRSLACPRVFKAGSMSPPRRSHPGSGSARMVCAVAAFEEERKKEVFDG
jgi:hypothetical protein